MTSAEFKVNERAILIFDGLFLHRPELRTYWDFSVFLDAPFDVTVPRGAARGSAYGDPDPYAFSNHRYIEGNKIYFREAKPKDLASCVIDYSNLSNPRIMSWKPDSLNRA